MRTFPVKRLIWPTALFFLFMGLLKLVPGHLVDMGDATVGLKMVLAKAFAIGLGLALAWLCVRIVEVFIWRSLEAKLRTTIPRLLKDMVAVGVFVVTGITLAKLVFNQPVTALWATSGVIAFVLGMALQNTIADLFCGIAINVDQPFKIDEWIEIHPRSVESFKGCVQEISWRSTRIRTTRNTMVVVPNSMLSSMVVVNLSRPEPRSRFDVIISLDFAVPTERSLRVLLAGVKAAVGILETPEPQVLVHQLTSIGVEYKVRYWVDPLTLSPRRARHAVTSSILEHLYQAGITPAYGKQDLFLARMPNRQLDRLADRETLLQRVDLFTTLNPDERKSLAETMTERQYRVGDILVQQGDPGDSMSILVEGLLGVYMEKTNEAEAVKLAQLIPGQFFGEMSLLTGEKRSATVIAATDAVVFEIGHQDLAPLLDSRPEIAVEITQIVAQRRREQEQQHQKQPDIEVEVPARQLLERMKGFFLGLRGKLHLL